MSHWIKKFRYAFHGIALGVAGQSSFLVHLAFSVAVVLLAIALKCEFWQWCMLGLCMALVLSLELINSSIEWLARGLSPQQNESVGKALDIASGAVLVAAIFAAMIGLSIFGWQVMLLFR